MKNPTLKNPLVHNIGDRFKYIHGDPDYFNIWEVITITRNIINAKIIDSTYPPNIGATSIIPSFNDSYEYLGNFSKSDNFNNLYSILCENPE